MKGEKPKLFAIDGSMGKCPSAPAWLAAQAKAEWRRAAPELLKRKLLVKDTLATLESYCVAVGQVREAEEIMAKEGRLIETENGKKPHPMLKIQAQAMREARLLAGELGLTPHRRFKSKEEKATNGKWDSLLA